MVLHLMLDPTDEATGETLTVVTNNDTNTA
jgi:hypothetical protein